MRLDPRRLLGLGFACLLLGAFSGCRHVVTPLDLDFDRTAFQERTHEGDVKHLRYQFVEAKWDSNGIGDIARKHGLETVHYADLETFAILGIFTRQTVHIYGR